MSANSVTAPRLTPSAASKQAAQLLGVDDAKRLDGAILIAAVEELEHNSSFARRVRLLYGVLPATKKRSAARSGATPKALSVQLEPIKHVEGFTLNTSAPVNPYLVYEAYGADQLSTVLDLFSHEKLKDAARGVEQRNPQAPAANKRSKAATIEYIVRYVTGK
jgi:hypothetical protein